MQREERRDDRAPPSGSGDAFEEQEEEQAVRNMNERIDEQMPAGIETKELAIQHVRKPGQRVPVGGVKRGESPGNPGQREPARDDGIVPDVEVVIEVDELMTDHLPVNREGGNGQRCRDQQLTPAKAPRRLRGPNDSWLLAVASLAAAERTTLLFHSASFPGHTIQTNPQITQASPAGHTAMPFETNAT